MIVVDDAILAFLRSDDVIAGNSPVDDDNRNVYDGQLVPPRPPGAPPQVVTFELPYLVYMSSVGADDNPRLAGRRVRRSVFFQLTYVGTSREQAKWLGERARDLLEFHRLEVEGYPPDKQWKVRCEESQRVWRDDDAVQPDGAPLYYGVDQYAVSLMHTRVPSLVSSP